MQVPISPINDEATSEGERLVRAFLDVFGDDNASRTPSQRIVWHWLEHTSYAKLPLFIQGQDGKMDPYAAAVYSGRREIFLAIDAIISNAFQQSEVKVSR